MSDGQGVTQLLQQWREGQDSALEKLTPIIYDELRRLAKSYVRQERSNHTLSPTALVNEAYLRLMAQDQPDWQSRKHFFGVAAHLMRQVLVDYGRRQRSAKRGGREPTIALAEAVGKVHAVTKDVVDLDDALTALESADPRKARAIELRFFGGLTVEEIADSLNVSAATISRELRLAEAWLARELRRS